MRLYEFESKLLLQKHGVPVPPGVVLTSKAPSPFLPCVVKAQLLFGKRADLGAIKICRDKKQADEAISKLLNASFKGEKVNGVLVEELVEMDKQFYASFVFDTDARSPVLLFSAQGGTGVEQRSVQKLVINELKGLSESDAESFLKEHKVLAPLLVSLWKVFVVEDCKLLEINPIAQSKSGFVCLDAHVELDDFAASRHKERVYAERPLASFGRPLTERERAVKLANDADYHGTVKYVELDGNIALLAAGGGGSLTCMDALIDAGGKPANYSEFSGDPTEEKMYVLTKHAISKPGVKGCWIVGAVANFSRVDTMMSGIVKAFEEVNPKFPVVVRRAGPYEKEGLAILKKAAEKHGWVVEVYGAETPLTSTAELVVRKAYGDSA